MFHLKSLPHCVAHGRGTIDDTCMQTDEQTDSWMMKMVDAWMSGYMIDKGRNDSDRWIMDG